MLVGQSSSPYTSSLAQLLALEGWRNSLPFAGGENEQYATFAQPSGVPLAFGAAPALGRAEEPPGRCLGPCWTAPAAGTGCGAAGAASVRGQLTRTHTRGETTRYVLLERAQVFTQWSCGWRSSGGCEKRGGNPAQALRLLLLAEIIPWDLVVILSQWISMWDLKSKMKKFSMKLLFRCCLNSNPSSKKKNQNNTVLGLSVFSHSLLWWWKARNGGQKKKSQNV